MEIINKRLLRLMAQSEYGNMIKRESFFFLIKNREIGVIVRFKLI